MAGPPAVLVSKESALHCKPWKLGVDQVIPLNRTHSDMVKFRANDHEYDKVLGRLRTLVQRACSRVVV